MGSLAPLASPTFTGSPQAPTPPSPDSSNKIATTLWVNSQGFGVGTGNVTGPGSSILNDVSIFGGTTGKVLADSGIQIGALALLAPPSFTGNPTAPTQATGDNSTKLATTAFIKSLNYCATTGCSFTGTVSGLTASEVGLGNLTNKLQAYASIYPNTTPSSANLPIGNSGGSYTPQPISGDCTISVSGVST